MTENSFRKNIKKGKLYIIGANFLGSILFAFAAIYLKNYWLFFPVIALIAGVIMTLILLKKIENKFRNLPENISPDFKLNTPVVLPAFRSRIAPERPHFPETFRLNPARVNSPLE